MLSRYILNKMNSNDVPMNHANRNIADLPMKLVVFNCYHVDINDRMSFGFS